MKATLKKKNQSAQLVKLYNNECGGNTNCSNTNCSNNNTVAQCGGGSSSGGGWLGSLINKFTKCK